MPKRRPKANKDAKLSQRKQYNVGLTPPIAARVDEAAEALGLDGVSLIRQIVHEQLRIYEERAAQARGKTSEG